MAGVVYLVILTCMRTTLLALIVMGTALLAVPSVASSDDVSAERAARALRRAVTYFRTRVATEGGYLWRYAADFSEREGELPAAPTTVWVQPPGTPTVGMAYLGAYELTGDRYYLEAARETATALLRGQLASGGWDYRIEMAPDDRKGFAYRVDAGAPSASSDKSHTGRNVTTLDDNTTQAALTFLVRVDRAFGFADATLHEAVEFGLHSLLAAQYPNGAWPQRFTASPDPAKFPVQRASYPETWSREYPGKDYRGYYTFNDNTMADVIELMFLAADVYGERKYAEAGKRGGEFIRLAQMPEPQPGWAQQYDARMNPAWARKFEPPAVTGAESQRVMETLLRLFELTRERRFLEPLPRALAYYRRSLLSNGQLARFYELRTNRPLYFTKDYRLTYSDADLPTHYGFKARSRLEAIRTQLERQAATVDSDVPAAKAFQQQRPPEMTEALAAAAAKLVASQRDDGAWVEPASFRARSRIPEGADCLSSYTIHANVLTLARYIAAVRARGVK